MGCCLVPVHKRCCPVNIKWHELRQLVLHARSASENLSSTVGQFNMPSAWFKRLASREHISEFALQVMKLLKTVAAALLLARISIVLCRKLRIARGLAPLNGPLGVFLLGNMPAYIKNRNHIYHFLEGLLKQHGGRMKMPWHLFFDGAIYITDPVDVQHILSTNFSNYVKPQGFLDAFQEIFENSFFAMNHHSKTFDGGAGWRLQRKVAAKVFTNANFRVFVEHVFARHAEDILTSVGNQVSFCCDMQEISARYTLQSIFDVAFGISLSKVAVADEFASHMDFINEHCAQRLFVKQYYKILRWLMPSERELRWRTREVRAVADAVLLRRLEESQEEINARSDLLSLFIRKAREADACSLLGPETLRSIILTFVFAGRDTTAECITYSFYAIARHPRVQERIVEELESLRPKSGSNPTPFTFNEVKGMRYLEAVVYEAIRLYPALPYNVKNAVEDDYLPDGTFVPAGVDVVYSPWYMGRNGALWGDDPLEFRPERWLEMSKRPSAYEFPAFQAGPRMCLGMNMAVLEAKLFLATTLRRFHVAIAPGEKLERNYVLKSGLFMENGLPLQLTSRLQCASSA